MIKVTPADSWYSKCVRLRANWHCERCGKFYGEGHQGLHTSHHHGRGNWSVRFDPDNALAACYGCHRWLEANPHEHRQLFIERLGEGLYAILTEKKNHVGLAKEYKRTKGKGEVAKHYKSEFMRMLDTGNREFTAWI